MAQKTTTQRVVRSRRNSGKVKKRKSVGTSSAVTRSKTRTRRRKSIVSNDDAFFANISEITQPSPESPENQATDPLESMIAPSPIEIVHDRTTDTTQSTNNISIVQPPNEINDNQSIVTPQSTNNFMTSSPTSTDLAFLRTTENQTISTSNRSVFEETALSKLNEILVRVGELEKQSSKIQAIVQVLATTPIEHNTDQYCATTVVNGLMAADVSKLSSLGLPVASIDALQTLEDNLAKAEFVNKVVSLMKIKYRFFKYFF